jgi:transposase-like protein
MLWMIRRFRRHKEERLAITARASAHPLSSRAKHFVGADLERCIFCRGEQITREGRRYKKLETVQMWYCHTCDRVFTPQRAKGKTYPLKVVLEALILFYRGETRAVTVKRIKDRFGIASAARPGSQACLSTSLGARRTSEVQF